MVRYSSCASWFSHVTWSIVGAAVVSGPASLLAFGCVDDRGQDERRLGLGSVDAGAVSHPTHLPGGADSAPSLPLASGGEPAEPEPLSGALSGGGGITLDGPFVGINAGFTVASVGDLNADGIDDFAVGAPYHDNSGTDAGRAWVVFGQSTWGSNPISLASVGGLLPGIPILAEATGDQLGRTISGGADINGDGVSDLLLGSYSHDGPGGTSSGRAYVVYGSPGLGGTLPLHSIAAGLGLGNADGFVLDGETSADYAGYSVAMLGDVNVDGYDDIAVGAFKVNPNGKSSGRTYVVFGQAARPSTQIDLTDVAAGIGGFAIDGEAAFDYSGIAVSGIGDVNGDGAPDIGIGASGADPNGSGSGRVYVVFGAPSLGGTVQLSSAASGVGGFALNGESASDNAGRSISAAGDVNADGFDDFLVGAYLSDDAATNAGRSYLVLGRATVASSPVELSAIVSGPEGWLLDGELADDRTGWSLGAAGDLNADGLDDILVSSHRHGATDVGRVSIAFGGDDPGLTLDADLLGGIAALSDGGFTLEGESANDRAGYSVQSVGDVNGDGVPDIGVGAPLADPNGASSGRAYVVFGDPSMGSYYSSYTRKPQLTEDIYYLDQGDGLVVSAPGILTNDTDPDGDAMQVLATSFVTPAGSVVSVTADGGFDFSPSSLEWWGEDTFEYQVPDGHGTFVSETVRVRVSPSAVPLTSLAAGYGGVMLDGYEGFDGTGQAVAGVGDIDGDGYADVVLGAHEATPSRDMSAGASYVHYGGATQPAVVALNPEHGTGQAEFDWAGIAVGPAGDFNGDGFADWVVGAIGSDANGSRSGRAYVVYGSSTRPTKHFDGLDGSNGFLLEGESAGDDAGRTVAVAGDVNGDGLSDLIVTAYRHDTSVADEGRVYVIYGNPGAMAATALELADVGGAIGGFVIEGEETGDFAGFAGAGAGDVNSDGFDDVLVGSYAADPSGPSSGRTYVVYGGAALPATVSLTDVADADAVPDYGIAIDGEVGGDLSGRSVDAAGDVNGDGVADVIVGAPGSSAAATDAGRVYIVFGGAALSSGQPTVELANVAAGIGGVAFDGQSAQDGAGSSVATLGDLNGDGFEDVIIGAPLASSSAAFGSGRAYVVAGRADFGPDPILLATVASGSGGFVIDGEMPFDSAGSAVAGAGDTNGDGYPDVLIGAYNAGPSVQGRGYIVFGGPYLAPQTISP